jgi:hypothetical protein
LEEDYLDRKECPIQWWRENRGLYPLLSELAKKKFNFVGTSVPCERIFSKAGNLITERRTRLSGQRVEQILFLNVNSE